MIPYDKKESKKCELEYTRIIYFFIFDKYDFHSFKNKISFKKSFFATG